MSEPEAGAPVNATITYEMAFIPHPWDNVQRAHGVRAWCLLKMVTPEHGPTTQEPVAIFNMDTEAMIFQGHVLAAGLDGKLCRLDSDARELFELQKKVGRR